MQPYFNSFAEFVAMGKHGAYVWSAWGVVVFMTLFFIVYSWQQRQAVLKQLKQHQLRQSHRLQTSSNSKDL